MRILTGRILRCRILWVPSSRNSDGVVVKHNTHKRDHLPGLCRSPVQRPTSKMQWGSHGRGTRNPCNRSRALLLCLMRRWSMLLSCHDSKTAGLRQGVPPSRATSLRREVLDLLQISDAWSQFFPTAAPTAASARKAGVAQDAQGHVGPGPQATG